MKILIIRFSSIGDIILTTPVIRCLRRQLEHAEIHFLVKKQFASIVRNNPNVDKVFAIENKTSEVIDQLKQEEYDVVIDLHRNLRSAQVKLGLKARSYSFDKLNYKKWLLVNLKVDKMPHVHIVQRYLDTVRELGVKDDGLGLDYFIPEQEELKQLPDLLTRGFNALVIGGSYFTKQIPLNKLKEICTKSRLPLVLLGGKQDRAAGELLFAEFPDKVFNACGLYSLDQSASFVKQASIVFTSDTGLMHVAAAFKKRVISLWGNTVPEFGMYPYLAGEGSQILEVQGLSCRPCSKLGYKKCPKSHFKCMNEIQIPEF